MSKLNFTVISHGKMVDIKYKGELISRRKTSEIIGISIQTLSSTFTRKNNNQDEIAKYINIKYWLKENNYRNNLRAYLYKEEFITVDEIIEKSGLTSDSAHKRGKLFEEGRLTKEELFKKSRNIKSVSERAVGNATWFGLSGKRRDHNLLKIPSPSKQEKEHCTGGTQKLQMFGDHTGNKRY